MHISILISILAVLPSFPRVSTKRLTPKEDQILRANCGRYVAGFTSLRGNKVSNEKFKILYGNEVKQGTAPWSVSIQSSKISASGTLISPYHVVSAAHVIGITPESNPDCKSGNLSNTRFHHHSKDFRLFLNVTCKSAQICNKIGRKEKFVPLKVKALYIRKGYVGEGCVDLESRSDLAVFELEKAVPFSKYVWPVCLPLSTKPPSMGENGIEMFGYGYDLSDKRQDVGILKTASTTVAKCDREYKFKGVYCTHAENYGAACDGDSGAGLIRSRPSRNVKELIGVVSGGVPCENIYEVHQKQKARGVKKLSQADNSITDVAFHLRFFCNCCGIC